MSKSVQCPVCGMRVAQGRLMLHVSAARCAWVRFQKDPSGKVHDAKRGPEVLRLVRELRKVLGL